MKKLTLCKKLPGRSDIQKVELGQKYVQLCVLDTSAYLVFLPRKFHRREWGLGNWVRRRQGSEY